MLLRLGGGELHRHEVLAEEKLFGVSSAELLETGPDGNLGSKGDSLTCSGDSSLLSSSSDS